MDIQEYTGDGVRFSYGDFHQWSGKDPSEERKKSLYVMPELLAFGDYDNSCNVERSNHRVFLEEFGKVEGVYEITGGYGSQSIAIRLDVYDTHEGIKEVMDRLDTYPCIDDDDCSQIMEEMSQEAWDNVYQSDVFKEAGKIIEKVIEDPDDILDKFEGAYDLFSNVASELGVYWETEAGGGINIDSEKVIPSFTDHVLALSLTPEQLPLLVSWNWSSKDAQAIYESRLKGK